MKQPTDKMVEFASARSILLRDMINKFTDIDVSRALADSDPRKYIENLTRSNHLERKINRLVFKICKNVLELYEDITEVKEEIKELRHDYYIKKGGI